MPVEARDFQGGPLIVSWLREQLSTLDSFVEKFDEPPHADNIGIWVFCWHASQSVELDCEVNELAGYFPGNYRPLTQLITHHCYHKSAQGPVSSVLGYLFTM